MYEHFAIGVAAPTIITIITIIIIASYQSADSPIHSAPQDDHLVVRVDSMPVCCERLWDSAGIEQGVR